MPDRNSIKYHVLSIKGFLHDTKYLPRRPASPNRGEQAGIIHNTNQSRFPGFTLIELLIARHPKPWRRKAIQGFTLIELLVVISILGILAAALMVAINPNK